MKFIVEQDVLQAFPEVQIGVLVLEDIDNRSKEGFAAELQSAYEHARSKLHGTNVAEHPRIHCWREAYRMFGAKPKKYSSSIENLVRRTLKGDSLRSINPLVDLYNIVSLKHLLPVGGEDLDRIEGDIRLTRAGDDEPAIQLLGEKEARAPKAGEVIYTDDLGAICRRWNWKEADRTKLTEDTQRGVLVLEALPPVTLNELEEAMAELEKLVRAHTGASAAMHVLDKNSPVLELTEGRGASMR
jgi:DNA/RNA-binding domain of Phe-tRNA-synthetase-like protein